MTRRLRVHFLAAYRVSPYRCAVWPVWRESTRARPISRWARFSKRRLLAMATTYSTRSRSRNRNSFGLAKPPSKRTRKVAPGKAARSLRNRPRRIPRAPKLAGALPGRSTAATANCADSSLNVTVATTGK